MNIRSNPDTTLPAVTTGPLPSSRKIFATPDTAPDLRVPLREIILSEGAGEPNLPVYDTSGPYTDPDVVIDVNAGLPRNRIAWGKERGADDKVVMLGDGSGDFTRAIGLELDRTREGMGMRSQRYSMLVENGVVKALNVEQPGQFDVSSAEAMLRAL